MSHFTDAALPEFTIQQLPADFDGVLVLSTDKKLGQAEVERIAEKWREVHAGDYRMAVIDSGMTIERLSDEDLRRIGLQRIPD